MKEAQQVATQFVADAQIVSITPFGSGLINSSWHLRSTAPQRSHLFLQRMNSHVFNDPEHIIANVLLLHAHLATLPAPVPEQRVLQFPELILTLNGCAYYIDDAGDYWRAFRFLENTQSLLQLNTIQQAHEIGTALGQFHNMLQGIALPVFQVAIADFHITPHYLEVFEQTYQNTKSPVQDVELTQCLSLIDRYRLHAGALEQARQSGLLPERLIHGDPKRDNILFDQDAKRAVSLIDLDTMQPGLIHYDIGDCMRSCCAKINTGDNSTAVVEFDLHLFDAILNSYCRETAELLQEQEYDWIYQAILLIPYELGLRFLTDYLNGNVYFRVEHPRQNLLKALNQFHLVVDIEAKQQQIKSLAQSLKKKYCQHS